MDQRDGKLDPKILDIFYASENHDLVIRNLHNPYGDSIPDSWWEELSRAIQSLVNYREKNYESN